MPDNPFLKFHNIIQVILQNLRFQRSMYKNKFLQPNNTKTIYALSTLLKYYQ